MYKSLKQFSGKSAANTAQTVSTELGKRYLVHRVITSYSAAPTQAGVTVNLDSGLGSDYDAVIETGTANARYSIASLQAKPFALEKGDVLAVTAPAGGALITSAITIVASEL